MGIVPSLLPAHFLISWEEEEKSDFISWMHGTKRETRNNSQAETVAKEQHKKREGKYKTLIKSPRVDIFPRKKEAREMVSSSDAQMFAPRKKKRIP